MLYQHSEHGLTLVIFSTAINCYAWILFQAGSPHQIIEWDQTMGRHGLAEAIRDGRDELTFQARAGEMAYNEGTPHAASARHSIQNHNSELNQSTLGRF